MKDCCRAGPKDKLCRRTSDGKIFTLPRKFPKLRCIIGPVLGFTMRASCAPFKGCLRVR